MLSHVAQGRDHLTNQRGVARVVRAAGLGEAAIEESRVPLAVVAADAGRGERVVLRRGPLLPALLASTAVPVLFPAVRIGGRRLIDGGVVANCDVEAAVESRMTDILAVDLMGEGPATGRSMWDAGDHALRIMLRRQTDLAVRAFRRQARIALLRPALAVGTRLSYFGRTMDLYQFGRDAAEAFLAVHLRGRRLRTRPLSPLGTLERAA
jgi:NTE family protein